MAKCCGCKDDGVSNFGGPCVCTGKVICPYCNVRPATHPVTLYLPAYCEDETCRAKLRADGDAQLAQRYAEKGF